VLLLEVGVGWGDGEAEVVETEAEEVC